ncbi:solute carrier organic anion transporter family member 4A1-like isoform X2 [Stylophora pistillata]|uniref:Solute carrier organic anion transporter family member n=2 Tax=Stylophora pistillata TaxID=50429 RepID=A0A2B4S483_STYPI|nr:solute carrier organic anion transporter family member 4A1-like isoform X2 [Stylophora pistillata]PFX24711.1 Solute carrier organic anion transporter family member 4A1 [Stylophora pistillata]
MIGMMTSSYDIAAMIITPLISYIGGSRKKPLFCAWGLFAMGVGFFIFMLPHFVSPPYDATAIITNSNTSITDIRVTDVGLCWANRTDQLRKNQCKEETAGGNTLYYALFVLGMVVAGAGCTPMYALGIPYMDENVKAKVTPMYVGIFVASGILGAAVGFVLISRFLLMFVEPGVQTSLTIQDKRWVGNWWIGFAIFGAICVFWSIWILGFPKEFPLTKKRRELDISATNTATSAASKEDSDNNHESIPKDDIGYSRLKDLPKATKLVFSSLPFLFVTVGACLESFVVAITGAFLPKVIETQFYQPPARAALLYGLVAVPSAFCGNIFGAYINKRLKLNMTDSARMCFIVALLGLVSCGAFLLRCNTPSIAGVNALYSNSSDPHQLSVPCNQACNCGKMDYTPVCDGPLNYFSPCHAGCNRINTTTKGSFYSNCACAAKSGGSARQVKKGNCYIDCGLKFLLFMVAVTLTPLLTFMNNTPGLVVTLRSVPPGQQSYALGLQMDLERVLGAIPGPIIFGALLDKTCILWSSRCGHRGFCLEYDHDGLAQVLVAVMAVCKFITATSFFLCWFFCQREKNTADKNTKENDEESFCCYETSM